MANPIKLPLAFYQRDDVLQISRELIGKLLITKWSNVETSGRIVECEAYAGILDRASHAFGGRRTARNEVMYAEGGNAYVYICYGIHHLFNVVTHGKDIPHAILIRALEPLRGIATMLERTGKEKADYTLTKGPGNLTKALGIHTEHNGTSLLGKNIWLADDGFSFPKDQIKTSGRIGVGYSGEHAFLPYRFYVQGNPYVSGRPK
jgi:DNA-3-methyladenine glycosylase